MTKVKMFKLGVKLGLLISACILNACFQCFCVSLRRLQASKTTRCRDMSRFFIIKIWYSYPIAALAFLYIDAFAAFAFVRGFRVSIAGQFCAGIEIP